METNQINQKRVESKSKIVAFRLNKKFYDVNTVKETLNAFRGIGNGKILEGKRDIEIIFQPHGEIKNLKEEICNYALGLMKNKGIV